MRVAFEIVFVVGFGAFCVGAFGVTMAGVSRLFLGRRVDDRPYVTVVKHTGGSYATFVGFWRMRRWAIRALLVGSAVALPVGALMLAIWGE